MASVTMPRPVASRASASSLQAFFAQALERVGRSARLVGAAAQKLGSGGFHGAGGFENLLAAFDRAGAAAEDQLASADGDAFDSTTESSDFTSRLTSL